VCGTNWVDWTGEGTEICGEGMGVVTVAGMCRGKCDELPRECKNAVWPHF
jgi:hypothetical protein